MTERPDDPGPPAAALGLFRFTIEGRQAPGLFVGGWIALLVGGSAALVGFLSGQSLSGALLFIVGTAVAFVALILLGGCQALERRAAGLAYAGPSPILAFIAVVAGSYLAAVLVAIPFGLAHVRVEGPGLTLLSVVIQALAAILVLRLLVVGPGALGWREMGVARFDGAALRDLVWGAILAAPVIIVTSAVVLVLVGLVGQQPASPLPPTGTPGGLAVNLLAGAVMAPAYEELFFRGFTLTAWRRMAGVRSAILRSALFFALIHANGQTGATFGAALAVAVVAAAGRIPVALVLGWVFDRRGSLWASIGLHATFNAILLVAAERAISG